MNAPTFQIREELYIRLTKVLGLVCDREDLRIFSEPEHLAIGFRYRNRASLFKMRWCNVATRHFSQSRFVISVLNDVLQSGVYDE